MNRDAHRASGGIEGQEPGTGTVVVTGASRGLGRGLVEEMLAAGWDVIAGARDPAQGADLAGAGARVLTLDVSDAHSVQAFASEVRGEPVHVLINNAGVHGPARQTSLDTDFDGFVHALEVNALGPLRMTQALVANLRAVPGARVVNISSHMGSLSNSRSNDIAYRASKAALNKITQCLATDLAVEGVSVVAVHPGWVRTDLGGDGVLTPRESAAGILALIERLDVTQAGTFFDNKGAIIDW